MNLFSPVLWLIAFRSLFQHKLRSNLLGVAITIVTTMFVLAAGVFTGIERSLVVSATTLVSGHVNVAGFYKANSSQAAPLVTQYKKIVELVKREVPELDFLVQRGRGFAKLVGENGSTQVGIGGIDINAEQGFRKVVIVKEGSLEGLTREDGVLLFEKQAEKIHAKVGDRLTLAAPTPRGTNNTLDVTVVAVAGDIGMLSSFNIFMNDKGLRRLYQLNDDTTGAIQLYLKDIEQTPVVQERLRDVLGKAGYDLLDKDERPFFVKFDSVNRESWTGQKLDVSTWEGEALFAVWLVRIVKVFTVLVLSLLVVVIAVGIMNLMWISIRERTREIGTLRAVGMQRTSVLQMFVAEGALLGVIGTAIGVTIGLTLCYALTAANIKLAKAAQLLLLSEHLVVTPSLGWMTFVVLFITLLITGLSLFPSFLAARLKPVTAMSHVG
jgi:ABC-type lipoprotein release transport system permease subunit